jgi:type VI secretion system protein ImpK
VNGRGGEQKTVILRPTPGPAAGPVAAAPAEPSPAWPPPTAEALRQDSAANALLRYASPLLVLAAEIRSTPRHADADKLVQTLAARIREFERCARAEGQRDNTVLPARYILCTLLDEAVMATPWGEASDWARHGLLLTFQRQAYGGEKFFEILRKVLEYPVANRELLELLYYCLAFGLEGRFARRPDGRSALKEVRERTYQTLRSLHPGRETALSPHWRGLGEQRDKLVHYLPLWVLASGLGLLLLLSYWLLSSLLGSASDPVYARMSQLRGPAPAPVVTSSGAALPSIVGPPPPLPVDSAQPTLRTLLATDVAARRVEIENRNRGEVVLLSGKGLFRSGSETLMAQYKDVVTRIGEALGALGGVVEITGHTDATPMKRTARFADNWALSKARAEAVKARLEEVTGQAVQFKVIPKGAEDPRFKDPTDARNRRVEIMLLYGS